MRKITKLLLTGLCISGSILQAQEKASYYKFTDIPVPLNTISDNGQWVGGSFAGTVFIHNTATNQTSNLTEEGYAFDIISGVSDNGTFVGTHGMTIGSAGAAYLKDGEWTLLETLNGYIAGQGMTISADSKLIGGCIAGEMGSDNPTIPVIWKLQNDGSYKIEALPYPDKDIFGMKPQGAVIQDFSQDASVLIGRFTDWTGLSEQPIIWILGSDNKYTYEIIGNDVLYNMEETNPGKPVLYDEYVTAKEGTPEYTEQYSLWQEKKSERDELMDKFVKEVTFGRSFKTNADGTRLLGFTKKEVQEDPEDPFSTYDFRSPYCVNLKSGTEVNLPYHSNACAVTNSGKIIYSVLDKEIEEKLAEAYIINENETEGTPLNEWLKSTYSLNIDEELTIIDYAGNERIATGNIILNKTENAFLGSFWDTEAMGFSNYIVKLPQPISPVSISNNTIFDIQIYSNGKSIKVEGSAADIEVTDISGKSVYQAKHQNHITLDFLPSGVYIVKASTDNGQVIIKKIALN